LDLLIRWGGKEQAAADPGKLPLAGGSDRLLGYTMLCVGIVAQMRRAYRRRDRLQTTTPR
jgi:hypothetical protein